MITTIIGIAFVNSHHCAMIFFLRFPCLIFLKVIGAASKEKLDVVKSLGASAVIDYNTESVKEKVNMFLQ